MRVSLNFAALFLAGRAFTIALPPGADMTPLLAAANGEFDTLSIS